MAVNTSPVGWPPFNQDPNVQNPQGLVNNFRQPVSSPFSQATSPSLGTSPPTTPSTTPATTPSTLQPSTAPSTTSGLADALSTTPNNLTYLPNAPQPARFSNIRYYDPNTQQFFNEANLPVNALGEFRSYLAQPSVYGSLINEIPAWIRDLIARSPNISPVLSQANSQGFRGNMLMSTAMAPNAIRIGANGPETTLTDAMLNGSVGPLNIRPGNGLGGPSINGYNPVTGAATNTSTTTTTGGGTTATPPPLDTQGLRALFNSTLSSGNPFALNQLPSSLLELLGIPATATLRPQFQANTAINGPLQGGANSLEALSDATRAALGLPLRAQTGHANNSFARGTPSPSNVSIQGANPNVLPLLFALLGGG